MEKTGAEILVQSLQEEGVEVLFGFPGGVVLNIYDVLFDSEIRHVLTRHEQGAAHAADGYARATGRVGVCMSTSGPGATNLVTGIATAYMDSIPIVALTGQVTTALIGGDAFQEADIVGITRPITKHSYLVKDVADLDRIVHEAFHIARTGRPGPVLVDLPKDVTSARTVHHKPQPVELRGYRPNLKGNPKQVKLAAEAIRKATRPVIYAGGGVILSGASEELIRLAELIQIPVTLTLLGLGGFPGTHELFLGMLGMHGTYAANLAVSDSDLILAIGARFDDRVTGKIEEFASNATVVHIDIDPSAISKNVQVDIPIVGDVKLVLKELLKELSGGSGQWVKVRERWLKQVRAWAEEHPLSYTPSKKKIKPQFVVEKVFELTKGEAIITTEVGQNQMWAAHYYKFNRPRSFLSSGGLGTMGYGLPAAIGAQMGCPDRRVIDIAGDGSIQMNIQELCTAVQYRLPVKVVILNNQFLGMVRQWQEIFYHQRYSQSCLATAPNFQKVAEAFGAKGYTLTHPDQVEPALKEALASDETCVLDFHVDREENVYPMVPPGHSIRDMLLGRGKKEVEKKVSIADRDKITG
ncbi:MAG: acetolactate synthase, large subunit, biosynthetic type [Deltaproteobacteria bacterium RBG_13_61_14]|nr:MAG: acetolactate synthase, large subunit, biosynthetic type [Deltaproteobacteria bacterium RBG_13_61_14]